MYKIPLGLLCGIQYVSLDSFLSKLGLGIF